MKKGFTMAEVLVVLGIIGVLASVTIPNWVTGYQKQATVTKLKKVYTSLNQIVQKSYAENGLMSDGINVSDVSISEANDFFEQYWIKYFNSPTVFAYNVSPYKVPVTRLDGYNWVGKFRKYSASNVITCLLATNDGTIIYLMAHKIEKIFELIVDLNGVKGPNILGKDVFVFYVNFDKNTVQPFGSGNDCRKQSFGHDCAAKIINDGWRIKDDYPWK